LKGERVRERALRSRTLTDRRSITLPLCVLAAGAIHGLAVIALLPMMITLPGPGAEQQGASRLVDVDVMPASAAASPIGVPRDPETTAAIPAAEHHPVAAPGPDRDADDAGGDDATVPAEPGIAVAPEPRIEPATTILTPVAARIPEPLPPKAESEPAVSVPPAPAVEEASPPPDAQADDEAPPQMAAPARVEPARLDGSGGAAATAVEPAEPEAEADAVEEQVLPPEEEAAKEIEPQPEAKSQEAPPPVPTLKPAKSAEPKARLTPQKKASAAPAKRRTARARRPVRTRTVTTVTQGGLFQDLFGPPQPAKGAALRQSTKKQ
jgi:hypothetical protein